MHVYDAMGSVVYDLLQAHSFVWNIHMGVLENPM